MELSAHELTMLIKAMSKFIADERQANFEGYTDACDLDFKLEMELDKYHNAMHCMAPHN